MSAVLESFKFRVIFRGISRLCSAFLFGRWFKLAHMWIQVTRLHAGVEFQSISKIRQVDIDVLLEICSLL